MSGTTRKKQPVAASPDAQSVVSYYLHGAISDRVAEDAGGAALMVRTLHAGLAVDELDELQASLDVPRERLAPMLGISRATLQRRMAAGGRLDLDESDRVVRYARLMGRAMEVLENQDNARRWLHAPQVGLGGAVPLEFARTELGAREVEDLLGRIEYGVYS